MLVDAIIISMRTFEIVKCFAILDRIVSQTSIMFNSIAAVILFLNGSAQRNIIAIGMTLHAVAGDPN
jgi:hypothetical protein